MTRHHNHLIHTTDNMTTLVLADSQGKYFKDHLEEHNILILFNSGDRIEDVFPKYGNLLPSFKLVIIQIGSNNCPKDDETAVLEKMQHLFEEICNVNPNIQVCKDFI